MCQKNERVTPISNLGRLIARTMPMPMPMPMPTPMSMLTPMPMDYAYAHAYAHAHALARHLLYLHKIRMYTNIYIHIYECK